LYNGYRDFPGGGNQPERDADPSPLLVPRSKKQSIAIPLLSLRAFVACKKGETYLQIKFIFRYTLIFTLFKDTVDITESIVSNGRKILNNDLPRMWKEAVAF
jgi:hypothetical protein